MLLLVKCYCYKWLGHPKAWSSSSWSSLIWWTNKKTTEDHHGQLSNDHCTDVLFRLFLYDQSQWKNKSFSKISKSFVFLLNQKKLKVVFVSLFAKVLLFSLTHEFLEWQPCHFPYCLVTVRGLRSRARINPFWVYYSYYKLSI